MAKKEKFNSKKVTISEEELSITKIGELETTEQSPLFVLILFGFILVFIFFLPTIANLIKAPNEKPDYSLLEKPQENNQEEKPREEPKNSYYQYSDTLSIDLEEKIKINEFALVGNTLSFKVTNANETRFSFQKDNYFLELYSEEDTLLERIYLGDTTVSRETDMVLQFALNSNTALYMKKLSFAKKEIADYPNVTLEKNENEEEVLICTKDKETLTYKFQKDKLFSISHVVNYSSTISNYESILNTWQTNSEKLNNMTGITSIFVDAGTGFVVNTTIDTKTAKLNEVENTSYYPNETLAKVVSFEMEARGFSCK